MQIKQRVRTARKETKKQKNRQEPLTRGRHLSRFGLRPTLHGVMQTQILATPKTCQSDWTRLPLIGPQTSKPPDGLSVLGNGHYYIKQRQRLTTKTEKQPNALQRTCSASLVRSASLSSSVMGSIFQCSSCREMKDKLNKTLRIIGRAGQALLTHQVSATETNWDYHSPTTSFDGLLVNRRVNPMNIFQASDYTHDLAWGFLSRRTTGWQGQVEDPLFLVTMFCV